MTRGASILVVVFVLGRVLTSVSQTPPAESKTTDKGRQIFTDAKLFPESVSRQFLSTVESFAGFKGMAGFSLADAGVASAKAPLLSDIEAKYGKADRVTDRMGSPGVPGPAFDAKVHWYGEFGFCVQAPSSPGQAAGTRVLHVLWNRR